MDWKLSLGGLLIGFLVGMTGMGGGSLMTPMLVLLFGFKPSVAIGTDILHGAVFKSFGAAQHRRQGSVHARLTFWMLLGSAPMSLLGVWVADALERRYGDGIQSVQARVLGGALVVGGIGFFVKAFLRGRGTSDAPFLLTNRDRAIGAAIGLSGGFVVGLTSVGSGTFFGLAMLVVFPLTAAKIVGTDLFHAAALLWVAGAGHIVAGNIDFGAMGWLLIGSIPGVLAGSRVTVGLPDRTLRVALALTLFLSGLKLLDVPGGRVFIPVGLGLGVCLLARLLVSDWARRQRARHERPSPEPAGELVGLAARTETGRGG